MRDPEYKHLKGKRKDKKNLIEVKFNYKYFYFFSSILRL